MTEEDERRFWETILDKPAGSCVAVYMNTPIFEVEKLPETTYQRLNFGPELH